MGGEPLHPVVQQDPADQEEEQQPAGCRAVAVEREHGRGEGGGLQTGEQSVEGEVFEGGRAQRERRQQPQLGPVQAPSHDGDPECGAHESGGDRMPGEADVCPRDLQPSGEEGERSSLRQGVEGGLVRAQDGGDGLRELETCPAGCRGQQVVHGGEAPHPTAGHQPEHEERQEFRDLFDGYRDGDGGERVEGVEAQQRGHSQFQESDGAEGEGTEDGQAQQRGEAEGAGPGQPGELREQPHGQRDSGERGGDRRDDQGGEGEQEQGDPPPRAPHRTCPGNGAR